MILIRCSRSLQRWLQLVRGAVAAMTVYVLPVWALLILSATLAAAETQVPASKPEQGDQSADVAADDRSLVGASTKAPGQPDDLPVPNPWPEGFPAGPWWNDGLFCGPNSLYVLLRLYELPISMEEVHDKIEIDPLRGCTPEQIKIAGEELGLPLEARFVPANELINLRRPFILHGAQAEDRDNAKGHFWVVVGYDEDYGAYAVIDGSSGIYSFIKSSQIEKLYSGWVVVPSTATSQTGLNFLRGAFLGSLALVVIIGAYLLLLDAQIRRESKARQQSSENKLSA